MTLSLILAAALTVASPDGRLAIGFESGDIGMTWTLARDGRQLIVPSKLGVEFSTGGRGDPASGKLASMKVADVRRARSDTTWETRFSGRAKIHDRFNEMSVDLVETEARAARNAMGATEIEKSPRRLTLVFRAYDEGVAFRYEFPEQEAFDGFELMGEETEWRFAEKNAACWLTEYKSQVTSQEELFLLKRLGDVPEASVVGMPVLARVGGSTLALTEAALVNWAGLFFKKGGPSLLRADLARLPATEASTPNAAVIALTPAKSPWRVVIVGDDELDLLRKNDLIANLNPPPDPSLDFSWVEPGATSWDWWVESNNSLSTELTLKMVDFAAEMGWQYHTVDGGWYGFTRRPNHGPNVPLRPRKDFDLARIVRHAAEKGVGIWVWIHWMEIDDTGVEETFARLEKWGVKGVKTDFLNRQDQWIVNWYEKVCRAAAKHHVMVNFHGAFKPTGTERTWPNNLTREGILGNEFNIFTRRITPEHCATLPFTRFLLGSGDFTPGSFANVYSKNFVPQVRKGHRYGDETDRCPHWAEQMGTRAYALAQCVAFDSRLMTLCDWPERYRGAAGIEALRNLPTAWKDTRPIAGACGEHYAVVRETHDGRFYFAAFTVKSRTLELPLAFLGDGTWTMTEYADDPSRTPVDAKALKTSVRRVTRGDRASFRLLDEGGAVAVFEKCAPDASEPTDRKE